MRMNGNSVGGDPRELQLLEFKTRSKQPLEIVYHKPLESSGRWDNIVISIGFNPGSCSHIMSS